MYIYSTSSGTCPMEIFTIQLKYDSHMEEQLVVVGIIFITFLDILGGKEMEDKLLAMKKF